MIASRFGVAAMAALLGLGVGLLLAALWRPRAIRRLAPGPTAWRSYRFGFAVVALIFVAFDMEMIFMYPWAVVFADIGVAAFLDMLVFIALLGVGVFYAWGVGGLEWE